MREYSNKQEKRIQKSFGFKRTANSGATLFDKGDLKDEHSIFECKTLSKPQKTVTLKKEYFDKLREEEIARGKTFSFLIFDFGDGNDICAIRAADFMVLYEAWKSIQGGGEA